MHNLIYNHKSLNALGFALKTKPNHTFAQRDITLTSIPNRNRDVIVDNGGYKNVLVKYEINSLPYMTLHDTNAQLSRKLIDWLSVGQNRYLHLTDTYNEGYFTTACVTDIAEIENLFFKAISTSITFSREPFWYSEKGQIPIELDNGETIINNTENYTSQPIITYNCSAKLSINGVSTDISVPGGCYCAVMDMQNKEYYGLKPNQEKVYISGFLFNDLKVSKNIISVQNKINGYIKITPNLRRL